MHIAGIGMINNRGRGIQSLHTALREGWVSPQQGAYHVAEDTLKDKILLKDLRRSDAFSKMSCLAAHDAFTDSGLGDNVKSSLGIILATAFGPHDTTFRFLDDILQFGEAQVSPTIFSHSVHNAAVSYISFLLQSRGPTLTVTQFAHSFHQAVLLAEAWLKEKRCDSVLVGSTDQCGKVMEYIFSRKLHCAEDGKIRPFAFSQTPVAIPGEGSCFFLVSDTKTPKNYCSLSAMPDRCQKEPDMYILDSDGMCGSEEPYRALAQTKAYLASYTPLFGSMLTVSSFSCAAAALMLKNQHYYASPIQNGPHGFNLCKTEQDATINNIRCVRFGCKKERIELTLRQDKKNRSPL